MPVWQRMLSGRRLDLLDPSALDVEIEDIAHGLARVARWNGQTRGTWPLSVAEHSLLVERIAKTLKPALDTGGRLAALLHDGHEYVVGDMISPLKNASGPDRVVLEERLQVAIHARFGLPAEMANGIRLLIRRADRAAAHLEAIQLGEYVSHEAQRLWGKLPAAVGQIELSAPMSAPEAEAAFLSRFAELFGRLEAGRSRGVPRGGWARSRPASWGIPTMGANPTKHPCCLSSLNVHLSVEFQDPISAFSTGFQHAMHGLGSPMQGLVWPIFGHPAAGRLPR